MFGPVLQITIKGTPTEQLFSVDIGSDGLNHLGNSCKENLKFSLAK